MFSVEYPPYCQEIYKYFFLIIAIKVRVSKGCKIQKKQSVIALICHSAVLLAVIKWKRLSSHILYEQQLQGQASF